MGRIVVTEFISLDGVVEDPGGAEDFKYGAWTFEIDRGDEGNRFKLEETMEADSQLLGRVTYEGFAEAWPSRDGEFADKFNEMPKYVVSSTLRDPDWSNSHVLEGDPVEAVGKLREEQDGVILVAGSVQLVQTQPHPLGVLVGLAMVEQQVVHELLVARAPAHGREQLQHRLLQRVRRRSTG